MKNKKALILAGGLGTRLRPLTFAIPKPLIPVRGRPIIDYILSRLVQFGLDDVYISLNYRADLIKLYLTDWKNKEKVSIRYFEETAPLGTAGPLAFLKKCNINLKRGESVLVINGDILTDLDFGRFASEHDRKNADLSVAVIKFTHSLAYGVLDMDNEDNITGVREKPSVDYSASAGIYLVGQRSLGLVPKRFFTMPELIDASRKNGLRVAGYRIKEHWLAIEQIKNLEEVNEMKKKDWISKL